MASFLAFVVLLILFLRLVDECSQDDLARAPLELYLREV